MTTMVTYTNKKGKRVTVPLAQKYALIAVDVFSKYLWVRVMQTPKGAGINGAWPGLKTNPDVFGTAKALDSILSEIDADMQDEAVPRRIKDLTPKLKIGTDNGLELVNDDIMPYALISRLGGSILQRQTSWSLQVGYYTGIFGVIAAVVAWH
eukprot:COSAG02_NODE_5255_length_4493_cov_25.751479_2_plen_152_part_00